MECGPSRLGKRVPSGTCTYTRQVSNDASEQIHWESDDPMESFRTR